eukprot:2861476-Heterocapsa_arctica.AAC.1
MDGAAAEDVAQPFVSAANLAVLVVTAEHRCLPRRSRGSNASHTHGPLVGQEVCGSNELAARPLDERPQGAR